MLMLQEDLEEITKRANLMQKFLAPLFGLKPYLRIEPTKQNEFGIANFHSRSLRRAALRFRRYAPQVLNKNFVNSDVVRYF